MSTQRHMEESIKAVLVSFPDIVLCILFGSAARGRLGADSDMDIAVAARRPLTPDARVSLSLDLSKACEREVDLVDLQTVAGPILGEICQNGRVLVDSDPSVYGDIIIRMLDYGTDMMPNIRHIWQRRRERMPA